MLNRDSLNRDLTVQHNQAAYCNNETCRYIDIHKH